MIPVNIVIQAFDKSSGAFASVQRGIAMLGGALSSLGGTFGSVGRVITGFAMGPVAGLVTAFGEAIKSAKDVFGAFVGMESQLAKVVAATGLTGEAAEQMSEQFRETAETIGPEFGKTTAETLESLEALVKAGLSGGDAITALTASLRLATIEGISMGKAANLVVQSMGMFAMSAEESAHVTDVLVNASLKGVATASQFAVGLAYCGKTASSFGWTIEEVTGALVQLNNQGITAEKSGRYLDAMFSDIIKKSDKLGFSLYDTSGQMLSMTQVVANLEAKLATFATQEERNNYLTEIFGRQGRRAALALTALTAEGELGSVALTELATAMGVAGSASTATQTQLDTTSGAMAQMQAKVTALKERLGEALAPAIMRVMGTLMGLLDTLQRTGVIDLFTGAITLLCNALNALIKIVGMVIEGWSRFFNALAKGAEWLGGVIKDIFGGSPGVIPDALKESVEAARRAEREISSCFMHISAQAYAAIPGINTLQNSINSLRGKTITITTVYRTITGAPGVAGPGEAGRPPPTPSGYVPAFPRYMIKQFGGAGIAKRPTWFLAGEKGWEHYAFSPMGAGPIGGGGVVIHIHNPQIGSDYDVSRLVDRLEAEMRLRQIAHGWRGR